MGNPKEPGGHKSASIGLKNNVVSVVPHCPEVAGLYLQQEKSIRDVVGNLVMGIEHVGSTSVPGLCAKPILDIAMAVKDQKLVKPVVNRLVEAGYVDMGDQRDSGGYLMTRYSEKEVKVCHLHIVEITNFQWRNYINFRDILRKDASIRDRYAKLKIQLAEKYPDNREAYMDGKNKFIEEVLGRIDVFTYPIL